APEGADTEPPREAIPVGAHPGQAPAGSGGGTGSGLAATGSEGIRPDPDGSGALGSGAPGSGAPGSGGPGSGPLGDAETLAHALQEALGQVRVEVDLGAVEVLVTDSLRSALADLPGSSFVPGPDRLGADGQPAGLALNSSQPGQAGQPDQAGQVGPRTPTTDIEVSAPYGIPAVSREGSGTFARAELERLVGSSVATAVDASLAAQLPELVRLLAASTAKQTSAPAPVPRAAAITELSPEVSAELEHLVAGCVASTLESNLARRIPDLIDRLATSGAPWHPEPEPTAVEADPVDVARRVAASVLSPAEIAETLLFRLRPLLDEHSERVIHREATEAERDRTALEQTRASLNRLAERMDRRLDRLEGEVRRRGPAPVDPDAAAVSATLRVLRPDDGR
nr:hypothetical protein [Actinomycetota bacterium]